MPTEQKPTATGAPAPDSHHSIWKYVLAPGKRITPLVMPRGARILSTAWQGEDLCIWAHVDTSTGHREPRNFAVHVTGGFVGAPETLAYVGTVHTTDEGSPIVLHVFEVLP